jgi:hypothetical protein
MALRKMGVYNDISPELFPKLPPRGTKVTYRFLETYEDPFSDDGVPVYRATLTTPATSVNNLHDKAARLRIATELKVFNSLFLESSR